MSCRVSLKGLAARVGNKEHPSLLLKVWASSAAPAQVLIDVENFTRNSRPPDVESAF